ncbi:MAG: leucine-rich repeat protein [Prevotella sp.]|nr:leucine-rich repeat protein [Prevotella sp.]
MKHLITICLLVMSLTSTAQSVADAESLYNEGKYYLGKFEREKAKECFRKAAQLGHSMAQTFYTNMTEQEEKERLEAEEAVRQERELAKKMKSYRLELKQPSTLLSFIQPSELEFVDSLTVKGFLYDTELKIITEKCINLRYLNIENALTTKSPETLRDEEADRRAWRSLVETMGIVAKNNYKDYRISSNEYLITKIFTIICNETANVRKSEDICVIPKDLFCEMKKLNTIILPKRLSSIGERCFSRCPELKEVKLSPYLKTIGTGSFSYCGKMEYIVFPSTLKSIGSRDNTSRDRIGGEASFTYTGIKRFDFSKCRFETNAFYPDAAWAFIFKGCSDLQEVFIPKGVAAVAVKFNEGVTCYVPSSVSYFEIHGGKEFHFASRTPPSGGKISNGTIYVPKGCTTSYFAKYGETNKYIEE